jgi:hypothetical protein
MAKIHLPSGVRVRTFTPAPAGFDPLKADAASLALHGAPPRPVGNPKMLAEWESVMRRVTRYVEPLFQAVDRKLVKPDTQGSMQLPNLPIASATSGLLGVDLPVVAGLQMLSVTGTFTVPDLSNATNPCIFAISLDRFTAFPLVVGVYFIPAGSSETGVPAAYLAFWAFGYQESLQIIMLPGPVPFPVAAGDIVGMSMLGTPQDTSLVQISFMSGTTATSFAASLPQGIVLTGQDAAWTVEPFSPGTLPNFGAIYFSYVQAGESCENGPLFIVPTTANTTPYSPPNCLVQVAQGEILCATS